MTLPESQQTPTLDEQTPRTDAETQWAEWNGNEFQCVEASFARALERELNAANARLKKYDEAVVPEQPECVKYLSQYEQADEDGVIVKVSRQAIDESLAHIDALKLHAQKSAEARLAAESRLREVEARTVERCAAECDALETKPDMDLDNDYGRSYDVYALAMSQAAARIRALPIGLPEKGK